MKIQCRVFLSALLILWSSLIMAKDVTLHITPKQTSFVIEVKAIPTTGFVWSVKSFDKEQFSFEGTKYLKPEDVKRIGAPLQEQFTFKLLKPLKSDKKIELSLSRSWEKNDVKPSTFIISAMPKPIKSGIEKLETQTKK